MYSQYQQYQQNGATTTSGQHWNGTSWVSTAAAAAATPTATSTQYTPAASSYASNPNANIVATYTQYYYKWKQRADQQQQLAQSLPEGQAKAQALCQAQWATYYAEQSTRAAHHYSGSQVLQTPPPLPPAPPEPSTAPQQVVSQQPSVAPQPAAVSQPRAAAAAAQAPAPQSQQQQHRSKWDSKPPTNDAPGGMKEYVHRCLARCSTEEEKQKVQKEVEKIITRAIQNGTMHTMDWNSLELIEIKGKDETNKRKNHHEDTSYYGRTADSTSDYYGPSAAQKTETTNYYGSENQADGYYGKSTAQSKKKQKKKARHGKKNHGNNHYGRLPSYDEGLAENDSYYGLNNTGEEDFIAMERSPKSKKKVIPSPDGFERSSLALKKRANRFSGRGGVAHAAAVPKSAGQEVQRYMGMGVIGGQHKALEEADYEHLTVKGTCRTLEKQYLRLTAPPKAELVRPQPILEQHVQNLKQEWSQAKKRDYAWFCSQFKAVRQDLTVQRINNEFTVDAYETHARIALQEGDLNEYNQCQTQLKELYDKLRENEKALKNRNEFVAYRIIYYVFLMGNKKYEGGSSDLLKIMLSLTPHQRDDPAIVHALKVRASVAENDYHAFFQLQDSCPNPGSYLMDYMVPKVRHWGLQRICKAYRPTLPVLYVLQELGFDPKDPAEVEEGKQWLASSGCVLKDNEETLSCKDSVVRESDMTANTSSLI